MSSSTTDEQRAIFHVEPNRKANRKKKNISNSLKSSDLTVRLEDMGIPLTTLQTARETLLGLRLLFLLSPILENTFRWHWQSQA